MFAFAESSQTRPRNKHVSGANIYLLAGNSASLCSISCWLRGVRGIVRPARFLHMSGGRAGPPHPCGTKHNHMWRGFAVLHQISTPMTENAGQCCDSRKVTNSTPELVTSSSGITRTAIEKWASRHRRIATFPKVLRHKPRFFLQNIAYRHMRLWFWRTASARAAHASGKSRRLT